MFSLFFCVGTMSKGKGMLPGKASTCKRKYIVLKELWCDGKKKAYKKKEVEVATRLQQLQGKYKKKTQPKQ